MQKYKAIRLAFGGRSSGDIGILLTVDGAVVKKHGGGAEYEIGRAFDVTVCIILATAFPTCVQCILVSQQAAVADDAAITFYVEGNGLSYLTGGIFYGNIFEAAIVACQEHGVRIKCIELVFAHPVISGVGLTGEIRIGDDGAVAAFADKVNARLPAGDNQLLAVNAFFNKDLYGSQWGKIPDAVNGSLYGGECACSVGGNNDIVWLVLCGQLDSTEEYKNANG
jgi:hypothetical protein